MVRRILKSAGLLTLIILIPYLISVLTLNYIPELLIHDAEDFKPSPRHYWEKSLLIGQWALGIAPLLIIGVISFTLYGFGRYYKNWLSKGRWEWD